MLTKTSISAIRTLTLLGLSNSKEPASPRQMADQLGESPTYLAKVVRHLAKAGILRTYRGMAGGVTLNRPPHQVTLLSIVEACQGTILADFCEEAEAVEETCAFHQAAAELHQAIVRVLQRWTLQDLMQKLAPSEILGAGDRCVLKPCRLVAAMNGKSAQTREHARHRPDSGSSSRTKRLRSR